MRAVTHRPEETFALAAAIAEAVRAGDVVVLAGDLGAGKTTFAKGFAVGCDVVGPVTSPTFTLVQTYEGRLRIHHIDVYRVAGPGVCEDLGLAELMDDGAVTLIEWGDLILSDLPADFLEVSIRLGDHDDDRTFDVRCVGPAWSARRHALSQRLGEWVAP